MKKYIYRFIVYIGLACQIFNPALAQTTEMPMPFTEELRMAAADKDRPLIEAKSDFLKLYIAVYLVDKFYPEGKLNEDFSGFLHRIWPKADINSIKTLSGYIRGFLMMKRRWAYVVDKMEKKIKASKILPKDAPVIAKDGEFAPFYSDKRKTTGNDQYKVSYTPYKYIGYDYGELGEPVRLRDKNYEPVDKDILDEIVLAILKFDIGGFYRAMQKLPAQNDGTREKAVDLGDGVKSRIILANSGLGSLEKVKGLMEVYVPKGWYINGDFLNEHVKPQFYLSEDNKEDLNIKEYEMFYPEAYGVVNNGRTRHILINSVKFPMTFTRRDTNKGIVVKGNFAFEVCQAKTDICHQVISSNELRVNPSTDVEPSLHVNFVDTAFGHLPPEKAKHAELKSAYYNPETGQLTVKFKTDKSFSNVAVMAEDAAETSFLNPKYSINEDEVTVTYDSKLTDNINLLSEGKNVANGGEIAITAAFDEFESLRTVVTPEISYETNTLALPLQAEYGKAFFFGLMLIFMPGILYLYQRLLQLFLEKKHNLMILVRFGLGSALGFVACAVAIKTTPWFALYENIWLLMTALLLSLSYQMNLGGYMNFDLFRPLKGIVRRGLFLGLFTVLFVVATPLIFLKSDVFDTVTALPKHEAYITWFTIWLGLMTLPVLSFIFRKHLQEIPIKLRYINLAYNLLFIAAVLWLIYSSRGLGGLITAFIAGTLIVFLWYNYPLVIDYATGHKRRMKDKEAVFDRIQNHAAVAVICIWLLSGICGGLFVVRGQEIPSIEEINALSQKEIDKGNALLFILNANWAPLTLYNKSEAEYLQQTGVIVKAYNTSALNATAHLWLKAHNKRNLPLNLLYTKRHKKGLALPSNLTDIDWKEALSDFKSHN